jgi:hypothetical protein
VDIENPSERFTPLDKNLGIGKDAYKIILIHTMDIIPYEKESLKKEAVYKILMEFVISSEI